MDQELMRSAEKYGRRQQKKKLWKKVVSVLGCIVVFCTTYALILPAITLAHPTYCGLEEHQHDESCYEMVLTCGEEEREAAVYVHHHTDSCYMEEQTLTCGEEETEPAEGEDGEEAAASHTHSESCYTVTETLQCGMEEGEEEYTDPGHTHTEACYEWTLVCQLPEHTHVPECYIDPDSEAADWEEEEEEEEEVLPDEVSDIPMIEEPDDLWDFDLDLEDIQAFAQLMPVQMSLPRRAPARGAALDESNSESDLNDFTQWITEVEASHKKTWATQWEVLEPGGQLDPDDILRFKIKYEIPTDSLSEDNRVIHYTIPDGVRPSAATQGTVRDSLGIAVGTYTIGEDGLITIEFSEAYAKSNKTQKIEGYISFESSVTSITDSAGGSTELKFKDDISITVTVKDEEKDKESLKVEKEAVTVNEETGEVTYTITVTSESGTCSEVVLKDVMTNIQLEEGTITVTGLAEGKKYTFSPSENGGFDMTLPEMKAGAVYTIEYTGQLPGGGPVKADVTAKNKVTVETEREDHVKVEDSAEVDTRFEQTHLDKTGSVNNGKITWTITVNEGKHDIGDWTLTDVLNGEPFEGPVKITDSTGKVIEESVSLPYTFETGSQDTYTVTYETPIVPGTQETVKNTAELTRPDDTEPSFSEETQIWATNNPLTKTAESLEETTDSSDSSSKTAVIEWKASIQPDQGGIPAPWTYTDELQDNQWFTEAQQAEIEAAVKAACEEIGMSPNSCTIAFTEKTLSNGETKIAKFQVTFQEPLLEGQNLAFLYHSTAPLGNGKKELTFHNSASVNDCHTSSSITYKPSGLQLTKEDQYADNDEDTRHNYYSLDAGEGILGWTLTIRLPEPYAGGALTLTEHLPEGMDLCYLDIRPEGVFGTTEITSSGTHRIQDQYEISVGQKGQDVTVVIPENLAMTPNLKTIYITVQAKIREDFNWPVDENGNLAPVSFQNTADVKASKDDSYAFDEQTQEIEKDYSKTAIRKSAEAPQDGGGYEDNQIPYSIVINEKGATLLDGETPLQLTDVLSYNRWSASSVTLVPNSVHVFHRNLDGTKGNELTEAETSYKYEEIDEGDSHTRNLTITIPDETPLIVEYRYKVNAPIGWTPTISNSACLEGENYRSEDSETSTTIKITESEAEANLQGVTIYKVDSDNTSKGLNGAKFDLYKYQAVKLDSEGKPTRYDYMLVNEKGTEALGDLKGVLVLDGLDYNTAYRLVEVEAPSGYVLDSRPYDFYITSTDTDLYPMVMPEGFAGKAHMPGDVIYRPNVSNKTSVQVDKKWFNAQGEEFTQTMTDDRTITVQLYRTEHDTPPDSGEGGAGAKTAVVTIDIKGREGSWWTEELTNLAIGSKVTLTIWDRWALDNRDDWFNVKKNGEPITQPAAVQDKDGEDQRAGTYSFSFDVQGNTAITGYVNSEIKDLKHDWTYTPPAPSGSDGSDSESGSDSDSDSDATPYKTCTLSAANGWTYTFSDLPKYDIGGDGKITYYSYYVKEISVSGFTTSYENNGGIVSGTITIRNTRDENAGLALPETGGHGPRLYTLGGICLAAGPLMYSLLRRRKEGDSFG